MAGTGTPEGADRSAEPQGARGPGRPRKGGRAERKQVLLRLDPQVHDALTRWAGDELRSVNAQIELVIRRALAEAGRLPKDVAPLPRRGRPPKGE